MIWIVHIHDAAARQLKARPPDRRQRVVGSTNTVEVLAVLLRNEKTYR